MNPTIRLSPDLPFHAGIKNIIFDFGGVLCNIDPGLTEKAFARLGIRAYDTARAITATNGVFEQLETGTITPDEFRDHLRPWFPHPVSNEAFDNAWNALLLDFPEPRLRLLEHLRARYRIFLLSNSNEIHYRKYVADFSNRYGYPDFDALFEKAWFSFRIGLKKPDPAVFEYVLKDKNLLPGQTLFIDDTRIHTQSAGQTGMHAHFLDLSAGQTVLNLFA